MGLHDLKGADRMLELAIRANPDPQAAWALWCQTRSDLFANHPQTPLDAGG